MDSPNRDAKEVWKRQRDTPSLGRTHSSTIPIRCRRNLIGYSISVTAAAVASNLCNSFPTLFDLIDASATGELDGVDKQAFGQVVDQCYLCDMCYMTKCPYVPPHPWNVDFPHLMLRAKAVKNRSGDTRWRDRILSSTDTVGNLAGIPVVAEIVNAFNRSAIGRRVLDATLGVHPAAPVPPYRSNTLRKQLTKRARPAPAAQAAGPTRGKVALFTTCYGNRNEPEIGL